MVGEEVREEAGMREWGDGRKKHVTPRGVLCNLDVTPRGVLCNRDVTPRGVLCNRDATLRGVQS